MDGKSLVQFLAQNAHLPTVVVITLRVFIVIYRALGMLLLSHFSRVWLCVTPIDGSPPGSPVPGILQGRTLEWVAISFSNAWKWKVKVKSLSRVWLRDPMDGSLQGFSLHGIFQARVLEWVAIAFSDLVDRHLFLYLLWLTRKWSWEEGKGLIFRQEGLRDKSDSS